MIPRLHVVTDDAVLARDDFVRVAARLRNAARAPFALHLRGRSTSGGHLYRLATELAGEGNLRLFLNDRVDVALLVGAHGVQLGGASLAVEVARRLLPSAAAVGVSVHSADEWCLPRVAGADFWVVGTVFETLSHPGRAGGGPALIRRARAAGSCPVVAIGGISPAEVGVLVDAGAAGVAALRGIWDATDPAAALDAYQDALSRHNP